MSRFQPASAYSRLLRAFLEASRRGGSISLISDFLKVFVYNQVNQ